MHAEGGASRAGDNRNTRWPSHVVIDVEFHVRIGLEFQIHGWIILTLSCRVASHLNNQNSKRE
jgi:stringent starvation protein B